MCGITGALALNHKFVNITDAKPMTDILAHRGPDDAGYLFYHTGCRHERPVAFSLNLADRQFQHIAELLPPIESRAAQHELNSHDWDLFLGHRRLAILDVTPAGHQPMSDLSKNVWVAYNGEIYNFVELREELKRLGHRFRTGTDTEVVLYAYIEWGMECVTRFNGMFALALYDNFQKKLYLARDRYGIKPLYYTVINGPDGKQTLVFASEVKSILEYRDYQRGLDHEALVEYFTFQNIFSDRTLYKDIKLLPPATYLEINLPTLSDSSLPASPSPLPPSRSSRFQLSALSSSHSSRFQLSALSSSSSSRFQLSALSSSSSSRFQLSALSSPKLPALSFTQYWDYSFHEPARIKDEREYLEELQRLFDQAVERQLVSDVEVGSYLSGGMDSGAISCVAARQIPNLKTFTIGFDLRSASGLELGFDERTTSEYLSYLYKTEHYEMVLKSGDMERCLPRFAWHLEEPRVGQSYPNFYAAKLAGSFVKVCLSGGGGDELFGGYPWRYYRAVVNQDFDAYIDKYYQFWQRLIPNKDLHRVLAPIWDKVDHVWTRDIFKDVFPDKHQMPCSPEEYVNRSLYFEAKTFLHGLFVVEDKLSMAHSLETRVPFMDNDLVDFAMTLPVKFKLGNLQEVIKLDENEPAGKRDKYFQKTRDGKLLLRKMMRNYVPEDIANGIKQGFSSPDQSWFKGDSIDFVKKRILCQDSPLYSYFDRASLKEIVTEHLEGKKNRRLFIWSLINFDQWLRTFNIE